jgi:hypothetical protein
MRKRGRTTMTEPRIHSPRTVLFEPQKVADGQWTIRAQTPAGKILYIDRFASEVDAEAWIASSRRDVWLIEQGIVR